MKKSPTPQRVTALICANSYTGYGLHGLQVARDVERITGAQVSIRPVSRSEMFGATIPLDIQERFVNKIQPEPWEILIHPPVFCPTPGKKTLYWTMWESTKLPAMSPAMLNKAAVVVVPCKMNEAAFSANGVTVPIRRVPLGVNTDVFRFRPYPEHNLCVFGAAGRLAHGGVRKGVNAVVDAFKKAFPKEKDVRMRVKGFPDCDIKKVKDRRVEIIQAYLSEEGVAQFLASLNCFVSAARGEAWGLLQHQSLAVGRPIISNSFAGLAEFFTPDIGYDIPYRMETAEGCYQGCGNWAVPNEDAMIEAMRSVYNNRIEAIDKGVRAAQAVAHLSWDNSNRKLVEVLKEFGALK